jgi:hypothetical protein
LFSAGLQKTSHLSVLKEPQRLVDEHIVILEDGAVSSVRDNVDEWVLKAAFIAQRRDRGRIGSFA